MTDNMMPELTLEPTAAAEAVPQLTLEPTAPEVPEPEEKKIEPVSMGEIAEAAGIGRATLFRYYSSKLELVIAVCTREWKAYLDALDQVRPISSVGEIPA